MRQLTPLLILALLAACRDVELPTPTALKPGVLRATLLTTLPGRSELSPATGATVKLIGTTQGATADSDGNLVLTDLHVTKGKLVFSLDLDGSGSIDRSRSLTLEGLNAGFGKEVNIGQLVLGRNATLVGRVLRADRAQLNSGHGGIVVFLPELPQLTVTGDDGSYRLVGVPEGENTIGFSATGYRAEAASLAVTAGLEQRVDEVELIADPGASPVGQLTGLVQSPDGTPIAAVTVRAASRGLETSVQTTAEGAFTFGTLETGVYVIGLEKSGLAPLRVDGVLVTSGINRVGPYVLTAGTGTLGSLDGGTPSNLDAGITAPLDAGITPADAGTGPIAIVTPYSAIAQGALATLNGTASTGAHPLIYSWSQLTDAGVTLSDNRTASAHSPTFTAPNNGTIIEFQLAVTDRFGQTSTNTAITRVGVGGTPTAKFGPDAGAYTGGDSITLVSASSDPGGLLLTEYAWSMPADAGATLTPNGATALLTLPALAPTDSPIVVAVELVVTSSVGVKSAPFRQSYGVTPGSGTNWSLKAALAGAPVLPIVSNGSNAPLRIDTVLTTNVVAPSVSYSWSCPGAGSTLSDLGDGDVEFAVPVIEGPDRSIVCTLTATGAAPLSPSTLTANVGVSFRDGVAPTLVTSRPSFSNTNGSPFGLYLRASELVSFVPSANTCNPMQAEATGNAALFYISYAATNCSSYQVTLGDRATVANNVTLLAAPAFTLNMTWRGPLVSTTDFVDPRPAIVTAGALPFDEQSIAPPMMPPLPFELVAREGSNLVTFGTNFMAAPETCSPDCPIIATQTPLSGLNAAVAAPLGERVAHSGQTLLVAMQRETTGLLDTLYAVRTPAGIWSSLAAGGEIHNSGAEARRMRRSGAGLISDVYDPTTNTFVFAEQVVADAGIDVVSINTSEAHAGRRGTVSIVLGSGPINSYKRNPATATWEPTSHHQPTDTLYGRTFQNDDSGLNYAFGLFVRSSAPEMMGFDTSARPVNSLGPVTGGFDFAQRNDHQYIAVSQNGDLRLYRGRTTGLNPMTGPPRAVPLPPGDERFDNDVSCEAAWPRLAFIEDALVLTWQERCAPETRWKIIARVMR